MVLEGIWNYISTEFTLTNIGWWVTTFGVAVPVAVYIYAQWREKKERTKRSCEAILSELRDNQDAFEPCKYPVTIHSVQPAMNSGAIRISSENPIKFTRVNLNSDAYKSILYSGLLTYLPTDTQLLITELYGRIQDHNEYVKHLDEVEDYFILDPESETRRRWLAKKLRYYRFLSDIESEMLILFEGVRKSIEDRRFLRKR